MVDKMDGKLPYGHDTDIREHLEDCKDNSVEFLMPRLPIRKKHCLFTVSFVFDFLIGSFH